MHTSVYGAPYPSTHRTLTRQIWALPSAHYGRLPPVFRIGTLALAEAIASLRRKATLDGPRILR